MHYLNNLTSKDHVSNSNCEIQFVETEKKKLARDKFNLLRNDWVLLIT